MAILSERYSITRKANQKVRGGDLAKQEHQIELCLGSFLWWINEQS